MSATEMDIIGPLSSSDSESASRGSAGKEIFGMLVRSWEGARVTGGRG